MGEKNVKFRACHRHCLMLGTGLICSPGGSKILFLRNKWLVPQRNESCLVKLVSPSPFLKNLDFLPFWLFFKAQQMGKCSFPAEQTVFAKWAQSCDCMSISPFVPLISKCNTRLTKCCNERFSSNSFIYLLYIRILYIYIYIHNQKLIRLIFNSYIIYIYIYIIYIINHHQSSP